ncbi:MAG: type II toxin-antitoxin system VapC family toxin [Frankiaceae bacterium]|nr:type II toxin-antitoxin system VapC family toxin [Frankiaceae bacterium]
MSDPVVFLDSSALTKLVIDEEESLALERRLTGAVLVGSALLRPEVSRAVRRSVGSQRDHVLEAVLQLVALVPLDAAVLSLAATVQPWSVRTLDALHLATALSIAERPSAFIAYDDRLLKAARQAGLAVEQPGAG